MPRATVNVIDRAILFLLWYFFVFRTLCLLKQFCTVKNEQKLHQGFENVQKVSFKVFAIGLVKLLE